MNDKFFINLLMFSTILWSPCGETEGMYHMREHSSCVIKWPCIPSHCFWPKGWDLIRIIVESLPTCPKMPENLSKIYDDNPNVSGDPPLIFGTRSHNIICQAQPLLFRESCVKNCHLHKLFNRFLLWVQITHLYITHCPGICQIGLQQLTLSS